MVSIILKSILVICSTKVSLIFAESKIKVFNYDKIGKLLINFLKES